MQPLYARTELHWTIKNIRRDLYLTSTSNCRFNRTWAVRDYRISYVVINNKLTFNSSCTDHFQISRSAVCRTTPPRRFTEPAPLYSSSSSNAVPDLNVILLRSTLYRRLALSWSRERWVLYVTQGVIARGITDTRYTGYKTKYEFNLMR